MGRMNRRDFGVGALSAVGAASLAGGSSSGQENSPLSLPRVRWGEHELSRVLVGHNPIKGFSHLSSDLSREMRQYHEGSPEAGLSLLRRCEQCGINACQMGAPVIENLLRAHYERGGRLKWIATIYSSPEDPDASAMELQRILEMDPRPIGVQQLGNVSDALMRAGKLDLVQENLKRIRDAGLLVGLGAHNWQTIDYAADKDWDVDFFQCCFYESLFSLDPARMGKEMFDDQARQAMTRVIRQVSKPCLAFKILGAGRHCNSPQTIERAMRFAFDNIKPTDVVLLGMWQKYRDQVGENTAIARRILA